MKKSAILLTAALTVTACKDTVPGDIQSNLSFRKSLIDEYCKIDSIFVENDGARAQVIGIISSESLTERYIEYVLLCKKHGDTAFNRYVTFWPKYVDKVVAEDFESIDLVSDADFDPQHPARTSLADIADFRTISPKRFIDSGYCEEYPSETDKYDFMPHNIRYKWFYPVHKLMSELTPDDMTMMIKTEIYNKTAAFRFTRKPTAPGKHDMTLTMTTDEGKAYTAEFAVEFE